MNDTTDGPIHVTFNTVFETDCPAHILKRANEADAALAQDPAGMSMKVALAIVGIVVFIVVAGVGAWLVMPWH